MVHFFCVLKLHIRKHMNKRTLYHGHMVCGLMVFRDVWFLTQEESSCLESVYNSDIVIWELRGLSFSDQCIKEVEREFLHSSYPHLTPTKLRSYPSSLSIWKLSSLCFLDSQREDNSRNIFLLFRNSELTILWVISVSITKYQVT